MPRLKKTDKQRRAERFSEHYRVGKARLRLRDPEIAAALGVAESTLYRYKKEPDKLPLGKLVRLKHVLGWSDREYLDISN